MNKVYNAIIEDYKTLYHNEKEKRKDLEKEVKRLNKIIEIKTNRIQDLMSRLSKRTEKVERLNNIINKTIEYIEKELGNVNTNENIIAKGICLKIKEIIGSNKE